MREARPRSRQLGWVQPFWALARSKAQEGTRHASAIAVTTPWVHADEHLPYPNSVTLTLTSRLEALPENTPDSGATSLYSLARATTT